MSGWHGARPGRPGRIASLDQFRGYTVVGMLAVNYLGRFAAVHPLLKHHNTYCSYADTIMPQFFFAVGFAYRLTFLRRVERDGTSAAVRHALCAGFGLLLLGLVFYGLDDGPATWEELRELGVVGAIRNALPARPVSGACAHRADGALGAAGDWQLRRRVRVGFMAASAALAPGAVGLVLPRRMRGKGR